MKWDLEGYLRANLVTKLAVTVETSLVWFLQKCSPIFLNLKAEELFLE